uniref:Candidate secreted effector n=1 Tax=Meloidogyne incognita TaxID=6306 RepID=A0A914MV18_MELIC
MSIKEKVFFGVSIDSTSGASERMDSSFEASTQNDVPGSDSSGGGGGGSLLSRIKSKFSKAEVIDAEEDAKMSEVYFLFNLFCIL